MKNRFLTVKQLGLAITLSFGVGILNAHAVNLVNMGASPTYSGTTTPISDSRAKAFGFTVPAGSNYTLDSFSVAGHYTSGNNQVSSVVCPAPYPHSNPSTCPVIQLNLDTSGYTTTGSKVTWSGGAPTLICGATYWIIIGGVTTGGFVVDDATAPASTAGSGATLVGEGTKTGFGAWAASTTSIEHSWEVVATPVAGCPIVNADINLSGDKTVNTFATEISK